jgi:aminoglycoside phosphotransferase (APT) family kinase protein
MNDIGPGVERWIADQLDRATPPLHFERIAGGYSNRTYLVTDAAGLRSVLRCPPSHAVPAGAHDVAREHRILSALSSTSVPTPEPLGLCTDASVSPVPFYVMSFAEGSVIAAVDDVETELPTAGARRIVGEHVIDTLAELHLVDVDAVGLGDLARRDGYVERQLTRMGRIWEQTRTRELPLVEELGVRLAAAPPKQRHSGVVHADFRLGNLMVDPSGTVTAVLDWELCTLGDVLADVAFLLNNWEQPADEHPPVWMEQPPTRAGGFPTREELVDRYAARTGFDMSGLAYHRALAYWRLAVIAEGIKHRYEVRRAERSPSAEDDVDPAHLDRRVHDAAVLADQHLRSVGN